MNAPEIRLTILRLLGSALPYAMVEEQLLISLEARIATVKASDFTELLNELRQHGLVKPAKARYGDKSRAWILTQAGENELDR
jgi:hypothetical protein